MSLHDELSSWDGKSAEAIELIYTRYSNTQFFTTAVLELISNKHETTGATWLLKHHLEKKHALTEDETNILLANLNHLDDWQACLHALQSLRYLSISTKWKEKLLLFVREQLKEEKNFVRAWAYSGFYEIAQQFPKHRDEAEKLLRHALEDKAGSVRARVQNCLKRGFD